MNLLVALALLLAGAVPPGDDCCVGGSSGASLSSTRVTTWAAGQAGGGVRRPGGADGPPCTRWTSATAINPLSATDLSSFRVDPDGVPAELHFRDCGPVRQLVWVRRETPGSLARIALSDLRSQALVVPEPSLSPPDRGIVNLETWLAVADPGRLTATAAIPGLSVTASAEVASTTWSFGDGDRVTCDGVGVAWTEGTDPHAHAPCGHTFRSRPSDDAFDVIVTVTWQASWHASDGTSGDLGTVESLPATVRYPVHEIQTIGIAG